MTLWILFAIMAGAAAGVLLIPLSHRGGNRRIATIAIILLLAMGPMLLYCYLGSPDLPGQPYASRIKDEPVYFKW